MICGFGRAAEIETGKSNIRENLSKTVGGGFGWTWGCILGDAAFVLRRGKEG
ncbi:MAG: hypothetical protein JSU70_15725 [Phycisphaerales bacterium]|nr:MAG: hypothetical protein JSU70_15725 [Phycisphaerales bacterium]